MAVSSFSQTDVNGSYVRDHSSLFSNSGAPFRAVMSRGASGHIEMLPDGVPIPGKRTKDRAKKSRDTLILALLCGEPFSAPWCNPIDV